MSSLTLKARTSRKPRLQSRPPGPQPAPAALVTDAHLQHVWKGPAASPHLRVLVCSGERAADSLAKQRYQRGVETLLTVLETERRLRLAEQAIVTSTISVWNARIDLFLALGGDWGTDHRETEPDPVDQAGTQASSEIPNSEFRIPNSNEVL